MTRTAKKQTKDQLVRYLRKHAEITLECHPERDLDPLDTFGYESDEENREAARAVRELAERTEWGWCCVVVRARINGFEGRDSLGGCSYESETAFKADDYYTDMVSVALDELAIDIMRSAARASGVMRLAQKGSDHE